MPAAARRRATQADTLDQLKRLAPAGTAAGAATDIMITGTVTQADASARRRKPTVTQADHQSLDHSNLPVKRYITVLYNMVYNRLIVLHCF